MLNICRTCMSNAKNMIPIFNEDKSPSINVMIMAITSLELYPHDVLPPQICVACFETLEVTYYFKEQVIRCNDALQQQAHVLKLFTPTKVEEVVKEEQNEQHHNEENASIRIYSDDGISAGNDVFNVGDPLEQWRKTVPIDAYDPPSEEQVKVFELPVSTCEEHVVDSLEGNSSDDVQDVNAFEESRIKIEVEEHGVQFAVNCEALQQIMSNNETDDDEREEIDGLYNDPNENAAVVHSDAENSVGNVVLNIEDSPPECPKPMMSTAGNNTYIPFPERCIRSEGTAVVKQEVRSRDNCDSTTPRQYLDRFAGIQQTSSKRCARNYKCKICEKSFRARHLKDHMRTHSDERPFKCQQCNIGFKKNSHLKQHVQFHKGVKSHECAVCGRAFITISNLKSHMRTHSDERPFKCHQCDAAFKWNNKLELHLLGHRGDAKHKCEVCEKSFNAASQLKIHMRTHSDERPFKCQYCHMGFKQNSHLKQHVLLHTGAKSHECEVCGKAFTTNYKLKTHMRTHSDERSFKC